MSTPRPFHPLATPPRVGKPGRFPSKSVTSLGEGDMNLPIQRPVTPMLARSAQAIPEGRGWLYEPKLDGFRAIVHYDGARVFVDSRNGKSLNRYFPELVAGVRLAVDAPCVLDGEIVVGGKEGLDFEALQRKLASGRGRGEMGHPAAATLVAFDLIALREQDLTGMPFRQRRLQLVKVLHSHPSVTSIPQTDAREAAAVWLTYNATGIEGVVAKRANLSYRPGHRLMVKVRRSRVVDCVVGGYIPDACRKPMVLLLGLYDRCGILHHVGQTSVLSRHERDLAASMFTKLVGRRSFGDGRMPGYSRWSEQRYFEWVPVRPSLVCEVAISNVDNGLLRQPASLKRWRVDKDPADCSYSQFDTTTGIRPVERTRWASAIRSN